jgi:copper chaperone CopZ
MKNLKLFAIVGTAALLAGCASSRTAQVANASLHVEGVCGMCETRIEKAALIPGVRSASWDLPSGVLEVIYAPNKVTVDAIAQAIADAGHDNDKQKATDAAYKTLPGCCAYRDGVEKH